MYNFLRLLLVSLLLVNLAYAKNDELKDYGLSQGMTYSKVKLILKKNGWEPVLSKDAGKVSKLFPEIDCGQGTSAICSVEFKKANEAVGFIVFRLKGKSEFILDGTY